MGAVRVTVAYFGTARECTGTAEEELELTQPASLQQLFSKLVAIHPRLAEIKQILLPLVNDKRVPEETELKGGDHVALLPPVDGG